MNTVFTLLLPDLPDARMRAAYEAVTRLLQTTRPGAHIVCANAAAIDAETARMLEAKLVASVDAPGRVTLGCGKRARVFVVSAITS
jgi:hypothetical protein